MIECKYCGKQMMNGTCKNCGAKSEYMTPLEWKMLQAERVFSILVRYFETVGKVINLTIEDMMKEADCSKEIAKIALDMFRTYLTNYERGEPSIIEYESSPSRLAQSMKKRSLLGRIFDFIMGSSKLHHPFHSYDWTNACHICGWHVRNEKGNCAQCGSGRPTYNFLLDEWNWKFPSWCESCETAKNEMPDCYNCRQCITDPNEQEPTHYQCSPEVEQEDYSSPLDPEGSEWKDML